MLVGRILETIFRRWTLLLLLLAVFPLVALGVVFLLPRSYQTTASLWALRRYEVIGATGPESDLQSTPAQTQATALSELLQSRSFALQVANETDLATTLDDHTRSDPYLRDEALYTEISHHVIVASQGYNLFTITYENKDARIAQQVVQAVIKNYEIQSQAFSTAEAQYLLQSYQAQLTKAQQDEQTAAAAESRYLASHPDVAHEVLTVGADYAAAIDPQYGVLHNATRQAQTTVENLQTAIATINQELSAEGSGVNSLFRVIDPPQVAAQPVSRIKLFLIAGGTGLGLALLSCTLLVTWLVRRDRAVYTPLDLQKVTGFPVLAQLPLLREKSLALLLPSEASGKLLPSQDGTTGGL
jgi:uncharacterized protein involved in exopolysaccharide biosynthesis